MSNKILFRTAALQLQTVHNQDVVKVAGIVRSLHNLLKKIVDPEYRARVSKMDNDTKNVQNFIIELNKELNNIRIAIREGDAESYNKALDLTRSLSLGFWEKIKEVSKEGVDVKNILKGYTKENVNEPEFVNTFKKHLPEEFDLDLDSKKTYNVPLKSVGWYKSLTSDMILINRSGTIQVLINNITRKLINIVEPKLLEFDDLKKEALLFNISNAIINGTLISVSVRKHPAKQNVIEWGTTEIEVITAPFEVPGTGVSLNMSATLVDPRTARNRTVDDKLILVTTRAPKIITKPAIATVAELRTKLLMKLAFSQQAELKYTVLNELQLAEILRKGYNLAFGVDPTAQSLAGGWAQALLECGRPIKLPNNNIGNIKATKEWVSGGQSYFTKSTEEFSKSGKHYVDQDAKWRSYRTPEEGAAGYWKLIGNKYKSSMDWMAAGDPNSATVSLAMNHYFTANIEKYAKGVSSLYNEFMTKIAPQLPNLKSAIASPPGEKLELKPWLNDYKPQSKNIETTTNKEVDSLINTLYANNPLTSLVKNSLLKEILPNTNFLILVQSSDNSLINKIEYARVASNILSEHLDIESSIHINDNKVEIQGSVLGTPLIVNSSVQALCDCLSMSINNKISAICAVGFLSKYSKLKSEEINKNHKLFKLNKIS